MKRLTALLLANLAAPALFSGCAHELPAAQPAQKQVTVHSPKRKLQIRWVNEIGTSTDTLYRQKGFGAFMELVMGKEPVRLRRPYAVHVDQQERIFVSDPESHLVHLFDPKRKRYRIISAQQRKDLVSPLCLASDDANRLYITDSASGKVYRYHVEEDRLEPFSKGSFERPTGIALDPYLQRLYVVDTLAHQVVVLNQAGEELFRIGKRGEAKGEFNYPTDIAIDKFGRVLVNDTLNSRIQVFAPNGKLILAFGTPGNTPGTFLRAKGVATDSSGDIYVSDAMTDMIQIFDFNGRHMASFGQSGSEAGEFWMPLGLFIDQQDRLYAVDSSNQRVQMFEGLSYDPNETRSPAP